MDGFNLLYCVGCHLWSKCLCIAHLLKKYANILHWEENKCGIV